MMKQEIVKLLSVVFILWPSFSVNDETCAIYGEMLKDVSLQDAMKAIKLIASTDKSDFAPSVGKIHEALRRLKHPNEKTVEEKFTALIKLAEKFGFDGWEEVKKKLHPETLRTVNAITWRRFCFDPLDSHPYLLRDFKEVYQSIEESVKLNQAASEILAIPEKVKKLIAEATHEKKNQQALGAN